MKATWLGHAAVLLEGKDRIVVDPFLEGNPVAAASPEEISCDIVCVTHAHGDHMGDAASIAKRNDAPVVAIYEVATVAEGEGVDAVGMNIGGSTKVGDTTLTMTQAVHSSCFVADGRVDAGGCPAGFVIDSGATVYHAGDTGVFGDMALIGELYRPDLALLPIGDFYTMGLREATKAAELVGAPTVVPIHYNTFDVIRQDPTAFREAVTRATEHEVVILKPGESMEVRGQS